jgi:hypothetical protein
MDDGGEWPSGKALGSGPRIGGSNPSSPAMQKDRLFGWSFCIVERRGNEAPCGCFKQTQVRVRRF